jgi:hypothetical protein
MAGWHEFEEAETGLAGRVCDLFNAHRHKTMATLRRDGSPRISGTEVQFADGQMIIAMSADSVKARDLARDNRVAIHGPSPDPPEDPTHWPGDAKVSGRAVKTLDPSSPEQSLDESTRYRIDIDEVVHTRVGNPADHLVIESWHPQTGLRRRRRS